MHALLLKLWHWIRTRLRYQTLSNAGLRLVIFFWDALSRTKRPPGGGKSETISGWHREANPHVDSSTMARIEENGTRTILTVCTSNEPSSFSQYLSVDHSFPSSRLYRLQPASRSISDFPHARRRISSGYGSNASSFDPESPLQSDQRPFPEINSSAINVAPQVHKASSIISQHSSNALLPDMTLNRLKHKSSRTSGRPQVRPPSPQGPSIIIPRSLNVLELTPSYQF
jgi:hypothetical protein